MPELSKGQLVLYCLTGYEREKSRAHGSIKQRPVWSGPCRVVGKTLKRANTYDIIPLWGANQKIINPRDVKEGFETQETKGKRSCDDPGSPTERSTKLLMERYNQNDGTPTGVIKYMSLIELGELKI